MADQDLEIRVKTTADLSGLKQAASEVSKLGDATFKERANRMLDLERALPVPAALQKGGGEFEAGTTGLTGAAAAAERFGINVSRARNEIVTLFREMAAGAPISRTLGALFGSLGRIAGAAAVAVAPFALILKAVQATTEQTNKLHESVGNQVEDLDKASHKWEEIARNASDASDQAKIAAEGAALLEKTSDATRKIQAEQLNVWGKLAEFAVNTLTPIGGIAGQAWHPFTDSLKQAQSEQQKLLESTQEGISASVELARSSQRAFEGFTATPETGTGIDALEKQIGIVKDLMNSISSAPGPNQQENLKTIEFYASRLKELQGQLKGVSAALKEYESFHVELFPEVDDKIFKVQEITKELQKQKVNVVDLAHAWADVAEKPAEIRDHLRGLITELATLRNAQKSQIAGDLSQGPVSAQNAAIERQKKFYADLAANRELAAEGLEKEMTPAEKSKFFQEDELRQLQRQQALQRSLLPEGTDFYSPDAARILGPEGQREAQLRQARIDQLNKAVGSTPGSADPTIQQLIQLNSKFDLMLGIWR